MQISEVIAAAFTARKKYTDPERRRGAETRVFDGGRRIPRYARRRGVLPMRNLIHFPEKRTENPRRSILQLIDAQIE